MSSHFFKCPYTLLKALANNSFHLFKSRFPADYHQASMIRVHLRNSFVVKICNLSQRFFIFWFLFIVDRFAIKFFFNDTQREKHKND